LVLIKEEVSKGLTKEAMIEDGGGGGCCGHDDDDDDDNDKH
jgi:hypothetical protein